MSDTVTEAPRRGRRPNPLNVVLDGVREEVGRQDERWGEQNHPLHGGEVPAKAVDAYSLRADSWKAINAERAEAGRLGWDGILLEEVFEALAEDEPVKQLAELEQVAAVATNAAISIRRRHGL